MCQRYFFFLSVFRTLTLRVPGMGMTSGPCARSQASVTCPAEALCFTPICLISSTTLSTLGKFSFEYRGIMRRRSLSSKSSGLVCETTPPFLRSSLCSGTNKYVRRTYLPVRSPLPSGEYANTVTPSSRAACRAPIFGSSPSRVKGEYSTWIAEIGWTLCARLRVSPLHSQIPMYLILPSLL